MQSSGCVRRRKQITNCPPPKSKRSRSNRNRTNRSSSSSRRIPTLSTCHITILKLFTVGGLIPLIRLTTSDIPATYREPSSGLGLPSVRATPSAVGQPEEIIGVVTSTGATITSTSIDLLTSTTSATIGSTMPHIAKG